MLALARERIGILHDLSMRESQSSGGRPIRYIAIMESLARRMDITLPAYIKRSYCKKCKIPYGPETAIRIKRGKILQVKCSGCGDVRRFSYA